MRDTFPKHEQDKHQLRASDNKAMVGCRYVHFNSHRLYTVTDIVWNGDDDLWMVEHIRQGTDTKFVRTLANFNGNTAEGLRRFTQIKEE